MIAHDPVTAGERATEAGLNLRLAGMHGLSSNTCALGGNQLPHFKFGTVNISIHARRTIVKNLRPVRMIPSILHRLADVDQQLPAQRLE